MKKFLSILLAACMAFGMMFAFAGCDFLGFGSKDSADETPSSGSAPSQGSDKEEGKDKEDKEDKGDEEQHVPAKTPSAQELLDVVLASRPSEGTVRVGLTDLTYIDGGEEVQTDGAVTLTAAYTVSETEQTADVYFDEDIGGNYGLLFLRDGYLYRATGLWADVGKEAGKFGDLLAAYRESGGPSLGRSEVGTADPVASSSLALKLVTNLSKSAEYRVKAVGNGYALLCDPMTALQSFLGNASAVVGKLHSYTTIDTVLSEDTVASALETLFEGITADEVASLPALAEYSDFLPAYEEDTAMYDYLLTLVASEEFYAKTGLAETFADADAACLGELTILDLVKALGLATDSNGEPLTGMKLEAYVAGRIVAVAMGLLGAARDPVGTVLTAVFTAMEDPRVFSGEGDLGLAFLFDGDKNFTGVEFQTDSLCGKATDGTTLSGEAKISVAFSTEGYTFADLTGVNYTEEELLPADPSLEGLLAGRPLLADLL